MPSLPSGAGSGARASKEERQEALEQLAATLSEEEAQFLIRKIAQRRTDAPMGTGVPGGLTIDLQAAAGGEEVERVQVE